MKKLILSTLLIFILGLLFILPTSNAVAQNSADCLRIYHESQGRCSDAARACIDGCPGAQGIDLGPLSECLRSCDKQRSSCGDTAEVAYKACLKEGQPPEPLPSDLNEFARYLDEISGNNIESLLENPPSSEDWNLENPAGQSGEKLPESKLEPGSHKEWSIISRQDPTEGYKVTIEAWHAGPKIIFPSGYEYSTLGGESIVVPIGSKIITDNYNTAYISIQANGPIERFSMSWNSEVELRPTDASKITELRVNQGFVRFNTKTRTRVRLGREEEYTVNSKGTDFAVYYDPQTQKGAVEIYDEEVQVLTPNSKEYSIGSQYGSKIKRVEWGEDGNVLEKTAVPKTILKKSLKPTAEPKTIEKQKPQFPKAFGAVGLLALLSVALFWYRKKKGSLPLEGKVKLLIEKVKPKKE